jgi:hypothetical protein
MIEVACAGQDGRSFQALGFSSLDTKKAAEDHNVIADVGSQRLFRNFRPTAAKSGAAARLA